MHGHDPASIPAPARRPKPRNLGRNVACTCITAPCATGIFGAHLGASSGPTSVRPHDAASRMSQARMVFEGRVQIKVACSKALCCTMVLPIFLKIIAPNRSLSSSAPTSSRPTVGLCRRGRRLVDAAPGHQGPDDARHVWMPPVCKERLDHSSLWSGAVMRQASRCGHSHAAGRYGDARTRTRSPWRACVPRGSAWFFWPGSVRSFAHAGPCPSHILMVRRCPLSQAVRIGELRYSSFLVIIAQRPRAILFASAIATSIFGSWPAAGSAMRSAGSGLEQLRPLPPRTAWSGAAQPRRSLPRRPCRFFGASRMA